MQLWEENSKLYFTHNGPSSNEFDNSYYYKHFNQYKVHKRSFKKGQISFKFLIQRKYSIKEEVKSINFTVNLMPFIFYSNSDEILENLVFSKNIWGVRTSRVKISLENKPNEFRGGEKILWYSSESSSFFGYSTIKNISFFISEQLSDGYSAFELEDTVKFDDKLRRTPSIYSSISNFSLLFNNYRFISDEVFEKIISLTAAPEVEIIEELIEHSHNSIVLSLLKIGKLLGCDVWVANDLKNKVINEQRLGDLSTDDLNLPGFDRSTLNILKAIDVLWLQRSYIIAGFEVEHTTQIYSGLLRFSDLFLSIPNLKINAYIVAPNDRRNVVENQFERVTFKQVFDNDNILSEINSIYYSSLNLGVEIVESVYSRGGQYNIYQFLIHCVRAEWQDIIDQNE